MSCFDRFIGMWALALWDELEDKLILSRDRLGIKPLYFAHKNSTWYFGSEPKVILEQLPECRTLNKQAMSDYFSYRQVLGAHTFFQGISKVEAGTHVVISRDNHRIIRYWDLDAVTDKYDPGIEEVSKCVGELLESSINYRMISDVPVGSFLSGGLDSSILVQQMSAHHPEAIKTFTIGFGEVGFNEFDYAQEVADHCATDHTEVHLDAEQYLGCLDTMLHIKDAPLAVPNEIALHLLSKVLKQDVSVVLSGEGADELFGGYGRIFRSAYDYERVKKYGQSGMPSTLRNNLIDKYGSLDWTDELDHFLGQYSYMSLTTKKDLFTPELVQALGGDLYNRSYFEDLWSKLGHMELADKYIWTFQRIHLEGLLGRLDSATMSASVEGRVPFVDHRLVEYVNSLPIDYKMSWLSADDKIKAELLNSNQISEKYDITKYILRRIFESKLPKRISERDKVGFPVPLAKWMSGPLREYATEQLLSPDTRSRSLFQRDTVQKLLTTENMDTETGVNVWMMLNFEKWLRAYDISI
jgi:asparagine synthase (glutamine-hydrolysing)